MAAVLDSIPFAVDAPEVFRRLRMAPDAEYADDIRHVIRLAAPLARPKALYRVAFIEDRRAESVTIEGVRLASRVLAANLSQVERVFPYVATCGAELDALPLSDDDAFGQFCRDAIKEMALGAALAFLTNHLRQTFALGKTTSMHPGSGDRTVWPIEQQRDLFGLLGDVEGQIGVTLTDTFLMIPNKSVSGMLYPTEVDFAACQLCHRERCPNRRAPFDAHLWDERMRE